MMNLFKDKRFKTPLYKWPKSARKADWHFKFKKESRLNPEKFSDYLLPGLIILELIVFSVIFAVIFRYPKFEETAAPSAIQSERRSHQTCLEDATSTLFAVIIDNEIHSRLPAGLSKADLVFEAPAEAGITRFLAVYCAGKEIPLNPPLIKGETEGDFPIGPVRSLRPYFLEWAEELEAPIVHVGGSPEAMALAKNSSVPDLDQYYNGGYFTRSPDRAAPHNVFTTIDKLTKFIKNRFPNYKTKDRETWGYKEDFADISVESAEIKSVVVDYIRPEHLVRWVYDSAFNSYFRFQNGAEHTDGDGSKISAKNVVIQITDIEVIDEIGRRKIRTTGEGKAMIFMDGQMIRGTWKRPTKDSLTRFYDLSGEEIKFNKGKIWVEIVSENHKITVGN